MSPLPWTPNSYPQARRSDHIDIYESAARGQVRVPDPYHWMEEYSEETDSWTHLQESFTRSYLDKNPDRQPLEELLQKVNDYPKVLFLTNCWSSSKYFLTVSSSLLPTYMTTIGGIGFITVAWSLRCVSTIAS